MAIQFRKTEFVGVAVDPGQCPQDRLPEVIMSGRSNVGKSSLVNALADQRHIAKVSRTPGKTRQIVFFRVDRSLYLVDLPGYGHAAVSRQEKAGFSQLADAYLNSDRPIALILLLLDIRISPTQQDRQMLSWLESSGRSWRIVLTKADKLSRSAAMQRRKVIAAELDLQDSSELVICSTQNKEGIQTVRAIIAAAVAPA